MVKKAQFSKSKITLRKTTEKERELSKAYKKLRDSERVRKLMADKRKDNLANREPRKRREIPLAPMLSETHFQQLAYQAKFGITADNRIAGIEGLIMTKKMAPETLVALESGLADENIEIKVRTIELLSYFEEDELPEHLLVQLIALAWNPELAVRKAAALALQKHPDPRSIGPLAGLLGTQDDDLRQIVEESLDIICERLGPPPPKADADA